MDKNIILYGAPGTGKTYASIQYAVAIIEGKTIEEIKSEKYSSVFKRYLTFKNDELIAFTTFHQSYSYEEFIEGIRPAIASDDNGNIRDDIQYEIYDGIFKTFCKKALIATTLNNSKIFDKAWDDLVNAASNNGNKYIFTRSTGSKIETTYLGNDRFRVYWNGITNSYNDLIKDAIYKQWLTPNSNRDILSGGNRWLFDARQAVVKELKEKFNLPAPKENTYNNRVFIIDEINRGNISKIFGELISLIEPSKRIGASEEETAILPYSGQSFGVPDNVYIIGTMNTADRSIALIDVALRRRFSFIEVRPDLSLLKDIEVEGINIAKMLDIINKRITVLLDREHVIGHAYFLPLANNPTIVNLANIFEYTIIPLLQEYFYDDYEKIQLVLGDNQKKDEDKKFIIKTGDINKLFGENDIDFTEYYEVNKKAFMEKDAYEFLC